MSILDRLTQHLENKTGIAMDRAGVGQALERYLARRLPELGTSSAAYLDSLAADSAELRELIDVVTVPFSWFFRDMEQWDVVLGLLDRAARTQSTVRVWMPGSATGEEAYTMAMVAARRAIPIEIVASDINRGVLAKARRGMYNAWAVREVPAAYRSYFHRRGADRFELDEALRRTVVFVNHNLVDPPLVSRGGAWDLIMCRNVFIYLVREHAGPTLRRLAQSLRPGGWLMLGASDLVYSIPSELIADYERGRLVFRRAGTSPSTRPPPGSRPPLPAWCVADDAPSAPPFASRPSPIVAPGIARTSAVVAPPAAPPLARLSQPLPSPMARPPSPIAPPPAARAAEVTGLVTRANQQLDAGEWLGAMNLYKEAQRLDPLAAEPFFFAGVAHHKEGQIERAIHELRSSLFLEPALWPASLYLALCYDRAQRAEEAASEYRRVAETGHAPFRFRAQSSLSDDLEHWRREVIMLAERKSRRVV